MVAAATYSITSSATASSVGGTSRPISRAVLRLITSSNLFGACTGRSAGLARVYGNDLDAKRRRYCLDGPELPAATDRGRIAQHRDANGAWRKLFEQFKPLRADTKIKRGKSGRVAARAREAGNKAAADRI